MQAVVFQRRPLCLYIAPALAFALSILCTPADANAQLFARKPSLQIRLGGFVSTPLVKDEVSSAALDDSIPGVRSDKVTIKQNPGPIGTLALRLPLRSNTQLELNASAGYSGVQGDDGFESWDVTSATVGNVVLGFGYLYRNTVVLRAGVGVTKLFADEQGLFTKGNSIKPLLEGGVSTAARVGSRSLDLDLRVQSHSFSTATLRDNGGSGGNVMRAVLQIGTTVWGGR
jgi:hypothetical protein